MNVGLNWKYVLNLCESAPLKLLTWEYNFTIQSMGSKCCHLDQSESSLAGCVLNNTVGQFDITL